MHSKSQSGSQAEQKSSVRSALARFGLPVFPDLPREEDADQPRFLPLQAQGLAEDLFARAGLAAGKDIERYLVELFCTLPQVDGDVMEVLDRCQDAFVAKLEKDLDDSRARTCADQVGMLVTLAFARKATPGAKPWVDVEAFAGERRRLNWGPGEKTDDEKDHARFLNKILDSGVLRQPPDQVEPDALLGLRAEFPNFHEPIRFLAEQAAYARLCGQPFQPPAMLFTGPAGVGKTRFAAALAKVLGEHNEVINMASQSCGFTLAGMDRGWSSARPGMVFTALMHGTGLAPVILLDEIDKANQDSRSSPTGPLYALLEQDTARSFRDEYAGFPVDASHVVWLATANDTAPLPAPMLSRFRVFEIPMPSQAELVDIARSMLREMTGRLPQGPCQLPRAWETRLAGCSLRDLRLRLQEAVGRAALRATVDGEDCLRLDDCDWTEPLPRLRHQFGFA